MQRTALTLLLALFAHGLAQLWDGEIVPVADGLGWDGTVYGSLSRDLPGELARRTLPPERITRMLPAVLVALPLQLFAPEKVDDPFVARAYGVANFLLLLVAAIAFLRIARRLRWNDHVTVIGFTSIFATWAYAKFPFFYTVLTDTFALCFSLLSLMAYVEGRRGLLAGLTLLSAFTWWPTGYLIDCLLLLFPYSPVRGGTADRPSVVDRWVTPIGIAAVIGFIALTMPAPRSFARTAEWPYSWLVGSTALAMLYVFAASRRGLRFPSLAALRSVSRSGVVLVVAVTVVCRLLVHFIRTNYASDAEGVQSFGEMLRITAWRATDYPGAFFLPLIAFFGPAIILIAHWWKEIGAAARDLGPGVALALAGCFCVSLESESRHLTYGFPLLVLLLCNVLNERVLSRRFVVVYVVLSVVFARSWLTMTAIDGNGIPFLLSRRYFINHGPWLDLGMFAASLVAAVALWATLHPFLRRTTRVAAAPEAVPCAESLAS